MEESASRCSSRLEKMSNEAENFDMNPTCLGEAVLYEIIKQGMIRLEHPKVDQDCVFVWNANSIDQIEAVIAHWQKNNM